MTVALMSFPFRLGPDGSVVTLPQNSSDYYAELIAALIQTKPGELKQAPLFGVNDPTFAQIDAAELVYKVGLFGPPAQIISVRAKFITDTRQDIQVEFQPLTPSPDQDATSNL